MARSKASSKKQKGSIDFKKIKRKLGRKLPPPKNATDTTVKSKAIVIPEQSVASDKSGLALSRKGLTLKELLQQSSHHNAKIRRDALIGIKDLVLKYPAELTLHKVAILGKLRERISDDDKSVRETLYQLLKSVIFPSFKDIPAPVISLLMAYVFNAMTHLVMDIRLMAFKFFDLTVQHYPASFFLDAEKVLHNYEDILRNSQIYFQEKSKLKLALSGLVRCLSLLASEDRNGSPSCIQGTVLHAFEPEAPKWPTGDIYIKKKLEDLLPALVNCFHEFAPSLHAMPVVETHSSDCMLNILECINLAVTVYTSELNNLYANNRVSFTSEHEDPHYLGVNLGPVLILKKLFEMFPLSPVNLMEKEDSSYLALNVGIAEIFLHVGDLIGSPIHLVETFLEFIQNFFSEQIFSNKRSSKISSEKHAAILIPFIPKIVSNVDSSWKRYLLEAFTTAFQGFRPESQQFLACISAMEEMLLPKQMQVQMGLDARGSEELEYQLAWVRELPALLLQIGDKHPSASKAILHFQLRLGQCIPMNPLLAKEYDNMQYPLRELYFTCTEEGRTCYGSFVKLPKDCQELAVCCLYYFSCLDSLLLDSVASCCLCPDLDPYVLFRFIEVIHSAYKVGHVQIYDHISFLMTLVAKFRVIPERLYPAEKEALNTSTRATYKALVGAVCSSLSQMGDSTILLEVLQKIIFSSLSLRPPLDNARALLRVVVLLNPASSRLADEAISTLSCSLPDYLVHAAGYLLLADCDQTKISDLVRIFHFYMVPVFFLFARNKELLYLVFELLVPLIGEGDLSLLPKTEQLNRIHAVVSSVKLIHNEVKLCQNLSSCRTSIRQILQHVLKFQVSNENYMNLEEKYKLQEAFDQLRTQTDLLYNWEATDFLVL